MSPRCGAKYQAILNVCKTAPRRCPLLSALRTRPSFSPNTLSPLHRSTNIFLKPVHDTRHNRSVLSCCAAYAAFTPVPVGFGQWRQEACRLQREPGRMALDCVPILWLQTPLLGCFHTVFSDPIPTLHYSPPDCSCSSGMWCEDPENAC